jgi:nucleotidyltransferase/DNA polymerase involved in DNA repair
MPTLIAHLDADCFYVSAERVRDRFLERKPVGVLGNQGACVIAKSYEMKASGVATGEPIWEAVKKCPEGLYLKRDFRWYEVISRAMLDVVREFSPQVEYYSIDEFFLTVDADPQPFALEIQQAILQRVGVPVTIGVARTKTLAKLVSDLAKPFGALALIGREAEEKLLAARPVQDITGIAGRSAAKLNMVGIFTCLDLANARPSLVRAQLTVVGERLCYELNGERCLPIATSRPLHKNISRGGSIGKVSADPDVILAWVVRNMERLIEALEFHYLVTGKLLIIFEYKNGLVRSAAATLTPSARFDLMLDAVRHVWPAVLMPGELLYRMHLIADQLQRREQAQLGLFDPPPGQDAAVRNIKQTINARHGRFAVRSAATLPLSEIYADESHSYEVCDIHGKTCF